MELRRTLAQLQLGQKVGDNEQNQTTTVSPLAQ